MYIKKILWVIALIGLAVAAYFAYFVYRAMFISNTDFDTDTAHVYIRSTDTYNDVRIQMDSLLKDIDKFDALAERKGYVNNIKPGHFIIEKGMNNNDIINSIRSRNLPITVSFNNQESIEKLAGRISDQIEADSIPLLNAMTDKAFLSSNNFNEATALGMYIPNTYEFYWNSSAETFRDRMLKEYNRFWNENRIKKAESIGFRPDQVMALASIVHEESKQASEQPTIAGVYINRINNGIPLQADPTLKFAAYQLPEYENTIIKRVLNKHKDIESPYNTYKRLGLPPGLITMPDISAIDAVLNYKKHDYLYFVADAKKLGYHKFSKTLSQHNAYAREYHQYLNSQGINK